MSPLFARPIAVFWDWVLGTSNGAIQKNTDAVCDLSQLQLLKDQVMFVVLHTISDDYRMRLY